MKLFLEHEQTSSGRKLSTDELVVSITRTPTVVTVLAERVQGCGEWQPTSPAIY